MEVMKAALEKVGRLIERANSRGYQSEATSDPEDPPNDMDNMDQEQVISILAGIQPPSKRQRAARKPARTYTPAQQQLLGKANLHFIEREFEEALAVLLEVIRQEATLPDAYNSLASVYRELGSMQLSLEAALLGAHFDKKRSERWHEVLATAKLLGDKDIELYCLSRISKFPQWRVGALLERAKLYAERGSVAHAVVELKRIGDKLIDDTKMLSQILAMLEELRATDAYIEVLQNYLVRNRIDLLPPEKQSEYPEENWEFVRMMCDLYLSLNQVQDGIDFIESLFSLNPSNIPIRVHIYYGIFHLYNDNKDIANRIFNEVLAEPNAGKDYFEELIMICDAHLSLGNDDSATEVLKLLPQDEPRVRYRRILALRNLQKYEEAAHIARLLVEEKPDDLHYRLLLSEVLSLMGLHEEATTVVIPVEDQLKEFVQSLDNDADPQLTYSAKSILGRTSSSKAPEDFSNIASKTPTRKPKSRKKPRTTPLMKRFVEAPVTPKQLEAMKSMVENYMRSANFETIVEIAFQPVMSLIEVYLFPYAVRRSVKAIPPEFMDESFLLLVISVMKSLIMVGKISEATSMIELVVQGIGPIPKEEPLKSYYVEMLIVGCGAEDSVKHYFKAFEHAKTLLLTENFFKKEIVQLAGRSLAYLKYPSRNRRVLQKLCTAYPDCSSAWMLLGHSHFVTRQYGNAVKHYMKAYQADPGNACANFFLGICSLLYGTLSSSELRNEMFLQAFAFLKEYESLRAAEGDESSILESQYNLGLAYHTIGLYQYAIPYYRKVLGAGKLYVHEAAHNLSTIFQASGNSELARQTLHQYIVLE